jgi:aerobic-type carbon monoxide dehydrogenase small subunit (CoxS/CutS family)
LNRTIKNTILFVLVHKGTEYRVQTHQSQYPSLMSLIADHLSIPGFGLCSGMGSCGTCLVTIDGMSTLACSVGVNDELANTTVEVREARY